MLLTVECKYFIVVIHNVMLLSIRPYNRTQVCVSYILCVLLLCTTLFTCFYLLFTPIQGYCINGQCLTHSSQCKSLYGSGMAVIQYVHVHACIFVVQSDLFTTSPLVVLPYTSIQSDLFATSPLVVLPYTSIQSYLFTTSPLVVLPYTSIQSDLFTTSPLVPLFPFHYHHFAVLTNTIAAYLDTSIPQDLFTKRHTFYIL